LNILIINGPNLNLLGVREPNIYGSETLFDVERWLNNQMEAEPHAITWFQSNHEGRLIDRLHEAIGNIDGIIINPGALTHYSIALRDAITAVDIPTVEVHLSDIYNREIFRKISVIEDVCVKQISGQGKSGYLDGLKKLLSSLN
jgi:3-dehydroquinate dehydratase-2